MILSVSLSFFFPWLVPTLPSRFFGFFTLVRLRWSSSVFLFSPRTKTNGKHSRTHARTRLQPLGNQELWKFVHSVYGTELGFSSNDEAGTSSSIVCGVSASAGEASPLSEVNQVQPSISLQQLSSPSPSLHSAQTSNDDDSGNVLHQPISHNAIRNRHHHYSRRLQVGPDSHSLHSACLSVSSVASICRFSSLSTSWSYVVCPIIISATDGVVTFAILNVRWRLQLVIKKKARGSTEKKQNKKQTQLTQHGLIGSHLSVKSIVVVVVMPEGHAWTALFSVGGHSEVKELKDKEKPMECWKLRRWSTKDKSPLHQLKDGGSNWKSLSS